MIRTVLLGVVMLVFPALSGQIEIAGHVARATFGNEVTYLPEGNDVATDRPQVAAALSHLPRSERTLTAQARYAQPTAGPGAVHQPWSLNTSDATFCSPVAYAFEPASNTVQLHADAISNPLQTVSGPLTLELWAFDAPFTGSAQTGRATAGSAPLGTLAPGQAVMDVTVTAPFVSPPDGSYYLTIFLSEQTPTCFSASGYCHVAYGNFSGRLTFPLAGSPPPITIGNYISGNWFDPTPGQEGHGVQLEILPGDGMLAIWFVFTPDGTNQTWLYAQGAYEPTGNTVTLPTYVSLGAKFPPNFNHADDVVTQWGTLTFTFADCNNGTLNWTSTAAGYPPGGSFPITRATSIAGISCP